MAVKEQLIIELIADVDEYLKAVKTAGSVTQQAEKKIETSFNKITQAIKKNEKGFQGFGKNAGQAGIQFQQFVGQIQGGQSVFVALSQQAADLGIVLGAPLVGVFVSLAAVIAGTFLPALFDSTDATEDLTNKLKELEKQGKLTANQELALAQIKAKETEETKKRITEIQEEVKANEQLIKNRETLSGRNAKALQKSVKLIKEENVLLRAEQDLLNQSLKDNNEISKEAIRLQADLNKELEARQAAIGVEQLALDSGADPQIAAAEARTRMLIALEVQKFDEQKTLLVENNQSIEELEIIHMQNLAAIRKQGADSINTIDRQQFTKRVTFARQLFGALSAVNAQFLEDNKDINAGLIVADTAAAATAAVKNAGGNILAAAPALLFGAAQLAANNSAQKGGGSISGATTQSPAQTQQESQSTVTVEDVSTTNSVQVVRVEFDGLDSFVEGVSKKINERNSIGLP